jgi:hypothetical protein
MFLMVSEPQALCGWYWCRSYHSSLKSLQDGFSETIKSNFLDSQPALDALFAFNGVVNILEALEVDKPVEFVLRGESRADSCFVLADSSQKIVGDAYV